MNAKNASWDTVLHEMTKGIQGPGACEILLERGADIGARNRRGETALIGAYNCGVVKLLCQRGANMNVGNSGGMTALHHTVLKGDRNKTKVLLDHGADVEIGERPIGRQHCT